MRAKRSTQTVTIANGESLSTAQSSPDGATICGIITPGAWTAAAITFQVSMDGSTYYPLYDEAGDEVAVPSADIATGEARAFALDPADFVGWNFVKVRSGVNGTAVNQGAARTLILVQRPI